MSDTTISPYDAARHRLYEGARALRDQMWEETMQEWPRMEHPAGWRDYDDAQAHAAALGLCQRVLDDLVGVLPIGIGAFQTRTMQRHIAQARYTIAGMERIIAMIQAAGEGAQAEIDARWEAHVAQIKRTVKAAKE